MWRPWTKTQLQHLRTGWETEASYRIAGISAILLLLLMAIAQGLQRPEAPERYKLVLRLTSGWLMIYYFRLVWRIYVKSQNRHELVCPGCNQIFGWRISKLFKTGECPKCGKTVVEADTPSLRNPILRDPP